MKLTHNNETQSQRNMNTNPLDNFTRAYIRAALWSSTDNSDESGGEPLDRNYSPSDLSPTTLARIVEDCARFQRENSVLLSQAYESQGYQDIFERYADECEGRDIVALAGHDFWLTRNRHGCGFWDRQLPGELGDKLTEAAHSFGECDLYVGDDNQLYI